MNTCPRCGSQLVRNKAVALLNFGDRCEPMTIGATERCPDDECVRAQRAEADRVALAAAMESGLIAKPGECPYIGCDGEGCDHE